MTRLRRDPDVLWRGAPGFLAVSAPEGRAATVTGPGVDVWELLDEPRDLDSIVAILGQRYGGDVETIRRDVVALVDTLVERGFVVADD